MSLVLVNATLVVFLAGEGFSKLIFICVLSTYIYDSIILSSAETVDKLVPFSKSTFKLKVPTFCIAPIYLFPVNLTSLLYVQLTIVASSLFIEHVRATVL